MKDQEILKNLNVYNFTKAADKANKDPIILAMVFKGELHLSGINIIGPHLTLANHVDLLKQCRHLSKRQIQEIAVQLMPKPDVKDAIRKLPETSREITKVKDSAINFVANSPQIIPKVMALTSGSGANENNPSFENSANHSTIGAHLNSHKDHMEILSPSKYKIQFTASDEFKEKLQKVQDLMRHQCRNGDLEKIFGKALDLLLESELKKKTGKALKARNIKMKAKNTRSIPAEVKRKVWQRDHGQSQFKSASGKHCGATGFLQYDHIKSYAKGGAATFDNIQILCQNHNRLKAEREFGPLAKKITKIF